MPVSTESGNRFNIRRAVPADRDCLVFYVAQGFEIVSRSATDRAGRPYPLLLLEERRS